jgi:cytochrome d ubiquinol oxidase subunit II
MIEAWYGIVSFMLIMYVIFDGRNFGAGILHGFVAKTPEERRQVMAAIGPVFLWHEVWLIAFGGTLVAVFPRLMASAFSGYYLALMLILWCLILRGIALEVAAHFEDRMWQGFWDFVFVVASVLLAILFGAAGGNVVRGAPLDAHGDFAMAFFTNFEVTGRVGLLDWYTLSIAVFGALMLAAHGATYLTVKTEGPVHDRSAACAKWLWLAICPLMIVVSIETFLVRPDLFLKGLGNPGSWLGFIAILGSAWALVSGFRQQRELRRFWGSNALITALLATAAITLFPVMLYSSTDPQNSMTAYTAAADRSSLLIAAIWWPIAFILIAAYFVFLVRHYFGKVNLERDTQGYHSS